MFCIYLMSSAFEIIVYICHLYHVLFNCPSQIFCRSTSNFFKYFGDLRLNFPHFYLMQSLASPNLIIVHISFMFYNLQISYVFSFNY